MNQKILLSAFVSVSMLFAETIVVTPEQEENWQIKTEAPQMTQKVPLGEFMVEVVSPPSLLHTISLPFEANVKKLNVAKYQKVSKGLKLAEVTGTNWINMQQQVIADATEFKYHSRLAERKNILCKEGVIPQKECIATHAKLETYKSKLRASKALLQNYGASDDMVTKLVNDLILSPTLSITSNVSGYIVELNATPGKSSNPSDALFIIQEQGALWLESNIEEKFTQHLFEGQKIQISLKDKIFDTTVLQISPIINAVNQTRHVRFSMPSDSGISTGLRSSATLTISKESLIIDKTSVIKHEDKQIVFVKTKDGYTTVPVTVLAEDCMSYYIEKTPNLQNKIAVDSIAVLKNMLGGDDE